MLIQRIFEQAERAPNKPAIIGPDGQLTYAAFAEAIARARGGFIRRGLFGEGVVSLAVADLAHVWILALALRSLGLTVMTRGFDVEDAPELLCVVQRAGEDIANLKAACADAGVRLLEASFEGEAAVGLDEGPRIEHFGGQIVHTSGTTGVHKQLLIDPRFEHERLAHRQSILGLSEETVYTAFGCPMWTAAGYSYLSATWACGGAVVIDPTSPYAPLLHRGLTQGFMTPLHLRMVLAAPEGAFPHNDRMRLFCGGGTVTWAEVEEAKRRICPNVFNLLGSTEAAILGVTPIRAPEDLRSHEIPHGVEVQIVDGDHRPLPAGQLGRLRARTPVGVQGYRNDEAATAAFFRDGYFYTGDLARFSETGRLVLEGRETDVINIDGVKLSPGPIEDRLRAAVGAHIVLLTIPNEAGAEELYLVVESPSLPATDFLSKALWAELGRPVAARVLAVAAAPRNAMGKIVRRELADQIVAARRAGGLPFPPGRRA